MYIILCWLSSGAGGGSDTGDGGWGNSSEPGGSWGASQPVFGELSPQDRAYFTQLGFTESEMQFLGGQPMILQDVKSYLEDYDNSAFGVALCQFHISRLENQDAHYEYAMANRPLINSQDWADIVTKPRVIVNTMCETFMQNMVNNASQQTTPWFQNSTGPDPTPLQGTHQCTISLELKDLQLPAPHQVDLLHMRLDIGVGSNWVVGPNSPNSGSNPIISVAQRNTIGTALANSYNQARNNTTPYANNFAFIANWQQQFASIMGGRAKLNITSKGAALRDLLNAAPASLTPQDRANLRTRLINLIRASTVVPQGGGCN